MSKIREVHLAGGEMDEYHRAADHLKEFISENGISNEADKEDIQEVLTEFNERFSPEKLRMIPDDELLKTLFYTMESDNTSLCYFLEFPSKSRALFGSIAGGSAFKFGLFQRKEDGRWITGSPQNQKILTEAQALELAKEIRSCLTDGADLIRRSNLQTREDYEVLDDALMQLTSKRCQWAWMHKYYSMACPDLLSGWHSSEWQRHFLRAMRIAPSEKYYGRSGQLAIVCRYMDGYNQLFGHALSERYGDKKEFLRIGTSDDGGNHAAELKAEGSIGLGWNEIGDLNHYVSKGSINKKAVADALRENYYTEPQQSGIATKKANEIVRFFNSNGNTVFVAMKGESLLGLVDHVGEYHLYEEKPLGHRKSAEWHSCFGDGEKLPKASEGYQTSCSEISDSGNLLFLYEKYYYGETPVDAEQEIMDQTKDYIPVVYNTSLKTDFDENRIVFGAPGTGKSYTVEKEREILLGEDNDTDYERVTFHPDYSYANFVGTYKPVPCMDKDGRDSITYEYVPGPFMRLYVEALKSGRSENVRPFLLIIEEINRANVAAVFGDVFQLLDRDENGVSEYPIQASEDVRKYLARELGGVPANYSKIRIPNNMYIWATMNSADQGVFPMDTAFKRRWNFTYLGIDDNDEKLRGKYVILGSVKRQRVEWNKLRKAINHFLTKQKINEDKQLGPYFIEKRIAVPDGGDEIDRKKFINTFKNKVIMYLFEDAAKQRRSKLFEGCVDNGGRYSEICREFDEKGIGIFNTDIQHMAEPEDLPDEDTGENTQEA